MKYFTDIAHSTPLGLLTVTPHERSHYCVELLLLVGAPRVAVRVFLLLVAEYDRAHHANVEYISLMLNIPADEAAAGLRALRTNGLIQAFSEPEKVDADILRTRQIFMRHMNTNRIL